MNSYSETNVFTSEELGLLNRATAYVTRVDESAFEEPVRCHELVRAIGKLLELKHEDGVYSLHWEIGGGVDHSWLLVPQDFKRERVGCSILDVYAVGSLPQVQLLHCGTTVPHYRNFIRREARTDIDEVVVERLVQMMRMSKHEAIMILVEVAKFNNPGVLRLAAQLIGYAACPTCDYALPNCMCVQSGEKERPL